MFPPKGNVPPPKKTIVITPIIYKNVKVNIFVVAWYVFMLL